VSRLRAISTIFSNWLKWLKAKFPPAKTRTSGTLRSHIPSFQKD
jgi:hypothetical protein